MKMRYTADLYHSLSNRTNDYIPCEDALNKDLFNMMKHFLHHYINDEMRRDEELKLTKTNHYQVFVNRVMEESNSHRKISKESHDAVEELKSLGPEEIIKFELIHRILRLLRIEVWKMEKIGFFPRCTRNSVKKPVWKAKEIVKWLEDHPI
jgi:hypothetical protein